MRVGGTIYLHRKKDDMMIRYRVYHSRVARNEIIEYWRKMYAKKFDECYIQISPNYDIEKVNEQGLDTIKRMV